MSESFSEWCILELLGHRRMAGKVSEVELAGARFLRIDVPESSGEQALTQYYGAQSVYCLTPVTEAVARAVALNSRPAPVSRYEMPVLVEQVGPERGRPRDTIEDMGDDDSGPGTAF